MMLLASLGRYRLRTMQQVQNALGDELQLHAGTEPYDRTIKVLGPSDLNMKVVKNFYAPGGILWQGVSWPAALSVPVLVIDLNPRVLTNWVLLVWRRIAGRHTILWGHAFPRRGRRSMTDIVRGAMRTLASGVLSYTSTEADILKRIHSMPIHVAPNALYLSEEMGFTDNGERPDVVYVGRLVAEKKPELLVRGFEIAARVAPEMRLTLVGDGPELERLRVLVSELGLAGRVSLTGHLDEVEVLRKIYARAFVSVSPGFAGLAITQSFAFGVPMLIADNEPHAPEIEAAAQGENCAFFASDDPAALAAGLLGFYRDRFTWIAKGPGIAATCASRYSVEVMAEGIVAALTAKSCVRQ